MQCMTVEPFTASVLLANVDHVSSLRGIHGELMLLARGRATASALSGRRNLHARAETGTLGTVVSPSSRGAGPQEAPRIDSRDQPASARERRSTHTATRREGRKRISLATGKSHQPCCRFPRHDLSNFRIVAETERSGIIPINAVVSHNPR